MTPSSTAMAHQEVPTVFPWFALVPTTEAPAEAFAGQMRLADGDGWDPLSLGEYHLVVYNGSAWVAATLEGHTHA